MRPLWAGQRADYLGCAVATSENAAQTALFLAEQFAFERSEGALCKGAIVAGTGGAHALGQAVPGQPGVLNTGAAAKCSCAGSGGTLIR